MKNLYVLKITPLILAIFVLVACNYNNATESSDLGFPQEENPALTEFMRHQILGYEEIALFQEEQLYYYSVRNFNSDEDTISYFKHNESQLRDYYEPMFHSENHSNTLNNLFNDPQKWSELRQELDPTEHDYLPNISWDEDYELKIELGSNQINFSILEESDGQIDKSNRLVINVVNVNKEGFTLHVENKSTEEDYYIFGLHDLSSIDLFQERQLNGDVEYLAPYYPIFERISDHYVHLFGRKIIDTTNHQTTLVESDHYLSENHEFIYQNGSHMADGVQRIQKASDFLGETESTYIEFQLNFEEIANQLDMKTTEINQANVVYFNNDFIVLYLRYGGAFTGSAGSTNVIVDFQEDQDHPTFYLVDLGLQ